MATLKGGWHYIGVSWLILFLESNPSDFLFSSNLSDQVPARNLRERSHSTFSSIRYLGCDKSSARLAYLTCSTRILENAAHRSYLNAADSASYSFRIGSH